MGVFVSGGGGVRGWDEMMGMGIKWPWGRAEEKTKFFAHNRKAT